MPEFAIPNFNAVVDLSKAIWFAFVPELAITKAEIAAPALRSPLANIAPSFVFQKLVKLAPVILHTSALRTADPAPVGM